MFWPFKRKPKSLPFFGAGENWRQGDVAENISTLWWRGSGMLRTPGPPIRSRCIVISVIEGHAVSGEFRGVGLGFPQYPGHFDARAFRKVVLGEEAADRQVGDKLPVGEPVQ